MDTSGLRGITEISSTRFQVQLTTRGINFYIATFSNRIQAARAYDIAAQKILGSNANLNFPSSNGKWNSGSYFDANPNPNPNPKKLTGQKDDTTTSKKRMFSPTIVDSSSPSSCLKNKQPRHNLFTPIKHLSSVQ
jgi:hypothetical protein